MPTRTEVFAVIDGERNYQDLIWKQRCQEHGVAYTSNDETLVEDWLMYIKGYYNDAVQMAAHDPDGGDVLHVVRKLAGLCVACLEVHGCWERQAVGSFHNFHQHPVRDMVYKTIEFERLYQDSLGEDRSNHSERVANSYLVMFGTYLTRAFEAWTNTAGNKEALKQIGKLAGICVHCMEDCGAPRRVVDVALGREQGTWQKVLGWWGI